MYFLSTKIKTWGLFLIGITVLISCEQTQTSSKLSGNHQDLKVLRLLRTSAHKTLDPMKQFDAASNSIIDNVYDQLLEYRYLSRPYQLKPRLLSKMPEKVDNGLAYLFTLRKGVMFMDDPCFVTGKGRELTTDDVLYSLKRYADANVNVISYSLMKGFVVGLDEFRAQTKKLGIAKTDYSKLKVAGFHKINSHQFKISLTKENPLFLYPLATGMMSIIPHEAVEKYGEDFARHPVGTGPFTIEAYARRGKMVLKKNPNYFGVYPSVGEKGDKEIGLLADAGKKLPLVDKIELPLIEESQPAMLKFLKGEIDLIGMNKDDFSKMALKDPQGKLKLNKEYQQKFNFYTAPDLAISYISFNMNDPVVGKNKNLRKAIAYALNTSKWIDLMRNGRGIALKSIVPVSIAGSERDVAATYYKQNITKAKEYLVKAGYPDGKGLPPLTLQYRSTSKNTRQDFEYLRNELQGVGITLKANFQTFSSFLKRIDAGNFQMADSGWGADYPDAENFYQLLYGPNKTPGPNQSSFNNTEYNKIFSEVQFMKNSPERIKLFSKLNKIIVDEAPIVIRMNPILFGLYQKKIANVKRNLMLPEMYRYLNFKKM